MDLTGKMLIAMPGMADPRFEHSVVAICAHSADGAMGLIVNKPLPKPAIGDLLTQLGIVAPVSDRAGSAPILFGGPVEPGRGFVLHSRDWPEDDDAGRARSEAGGVLQVSENMAMTATRDILEDIAAGRGPGRAQLALGYAGWGAGQLEAEILANGWLVADGNDDIALGADYATKWQRALSTLGIDPRGLSAAAGRA